MKKIITRLFILGALIALLPAGLAAQQLDARQRNAETVVADGLAQLPAATPAVFNEVMGELAATGSAGVEMIAGMLTPADKGKNATLEYALNGITAYATAPGNEALCADVRKGLVRAIERCADNANRAFLFSQLQLCSAAEDAAWILPYLDDSYLADYAIRALISTPGTEPVLLAEARKEGLAAERKRALAYAFAEKRMTQAEPLLLGWLGGADARTAEQIYNALAVCGSRASLKPLAAAAAGAGYGWDNTGVADAYLRLLANLVAAGDAQPAVKAAKGLLKCDRQYVRGAALAVLADALGTEKAMPYVLAADYLSDPETAGAAAAAVKTIVAKSAPMPGGEAVRSALEQAREVYRELAKSDADAGYAVDEITGLLGKIPAAGFALLPTAGLEGWTAVTADPAGERKLSARRIAGLRKAAAEAMAANWSADGNALVFAGKAPSTIGTEKEYENFELWLEWRSEGEAGLAVRSMSQIRLGGAEGTGLKTLGQTDTPAAAADNAPGTWNTLYAKVVDDRITLIENGVTLAENVVLTNPCAPGEPVCVRGRIELSGLAAPACFRNLYIGELPSTPVFELSPEEAAQGYEVLFDGRSLHKWTGNTVNYVPLDGTIDVTASYGGSGNLYTVKEYGDFDLRFEFRFLRRGVNNGIGIRTPMGVDAAYHGMEIQILDHDAPIYKNLRIYQQHGSVYGIIPAQEHVVFGDLGTWNTMEIHAVGDRITVTVNGRVILDGDIRQACKGHNVSEDGSKKNPYTVDGKNHPGLFNKKGHLGLLGHGAGIQFRNLRVLDLSAGRQ